MILLSCHVENFGCISDLDQDFRPGMNIICEDNGWGKTTLSIFILSMFYGLNEKDREQFSPWQEGEFGGTLTFRMGDCDYRLERSFGRAEQREDSLIVYEDTTNQPTNDLGLRPGEKIFRLDREEFYRTVFVHPQEQLKSEKYKLTRTESRQLSELKEVFANSLPTMEEVEDFRDLWETHDRVLAGMRAKKSGASALRQAMKQNGFDPDQAEEQIRKSSGSALFTALAGLLLIIAGGTEAYLVRSHPIGYILIGAGLGLLLMAFIIGQFVRHRRERIRIRQMVRNSTRPAESERTIQEYRRLVKEIRQDEDFVESAEDRIHAFLQQLDMEAKDPEIRSALREVEDLCGDYRLLRKKYKKYRQALALEREKKDHADLRFALKQIRENFAGEAPFLVLDDPFIRLDDQRMEEAMRLFEDVSAQTQVLYLTCSQSRVNVHKADV